MKKKRLILVTLLILSLIIGTIPASANGETKQLKDLPTGSIVYDPSWKWEHKTGEGYTGSGTTKPVEWIIVAKDHTGYPTNSVTLLSNELIAKYTFDNSTNRGSEYGSNHWGNSGNPNATAGIRPFLNTSFFNTFSQNFKNIILETNLENKDYSGNSYTSKDKVFLPSEKELGGNNTPIIGTDWGYFNDNNSRIAKIGSDNWYYPTRSPYSGSSNIVRNVGSGGSFGSNSNANHSSSGVRPALNLKSDTLVKSVGSKWEIVYNSPPILNITNPNNGQTINSSGKITINGTVKDDDNDNVTISATIGGKLKSTDITSTSTQKNWTLEWLSNELNDGTYNNTVITAKDDKGNITTKTYTGTILVDKTKPTKPILTADTTNPTNKDVTITVTAGTDSGSGVDKTEYRIDAGNWTTYTAPFKMSSNGNVEARTIDKVGNISDVGSITISNINKSLPIITIEPYNTEWTNKDIIVKAKTDKGTLNQESYTFTENGDFTFIAVDEYGNIAEKTVTITNIDKIKPKIKITIGN